MKYYAYLALMLLVAHCGLAQTSATNYEWIATMKVVGEDGNPISGANADIGYFTNSQPANALGITDTNGMFLASHSVLESLAEVGFQAEKPGYYTTTAERFLGPNYDPVKWTFTETLVLKKIGKPIAMYTKRLNTHVPALDKAVGFDLMVGDWIAPYGAGINTDINYTGHFDKRADGESDFTLTVSFPKAGDGIQDFFVPDADKKSGLLSPHEAPVNGYQLQWIQTDNRKPGKPIETNRNPNRNYFFRVRTKLDENGNVISAHYGKIYGDFMQFTYYLNPTPNDRNIEFDPKQNLIHDLQSFEQVTAP